MDTILLFKFSAAFILVMALMFLLLQFVKRMGLGGSMAGLSGAQRLKVVEFLPLGHQHRLVLIRRDDKEHLLLLGSTGGTVVETSAAAPSSKDQKNVQI